MAIKKSELYATLWQSCDELRSAEATIRENLIKKGLVKPIFIVDASRGYIKDANKNRRQEMDIHKIIDVVTKQSELDGYNRIVPLDEIETNDFNLNFPRYIDALEAKRAKAKALKQGMIQNLLTGRIRLV